MKKGLIIRIEKKFIIIKTDNSKIDRLKKREDILVGDVIEYEKKDIYRGFGTMNYKKIISSLPILIVVLSLGVFLLVQTSNDKVYGVVSLDVNPSIQLSINKKGEIIEGKDFSNERILDLEVYMGMKIDDGTEKLIKALKNSNIIHKNDPIVISYVELESKKNDNKGTIVTMIKEQNVDYRIVFIHGDVDKLNNSNEASKTLGRKVIEEMLKINSKDITADGDYIRNAIDELIDIDMPKGSIININVKDYGVTVVEIDENFINQLFDDEISPKSNEGMENSNTGSDSESSTDEVENEPSTDEVENEPSTDEAESEASTDETENEATEDETENEPSTDETESESSTDEVESESSTDETESEPSTDEDERKTDESSENQEKLNVYSEELSDAVEVLTYKLLDETYFTNDIDTLLGKIELALAEGTDLSTYVEEGERLLTDIEDYKAQRIILNDIQTFLSKSLNLQSEIMTFNKEVETAYNSENHNLADLITRGYKLIEEVNNYVKETDSVEDIRRNLLGYSYYQREIGDYLKELDERIDEGSSDLSSIKEKGIELIAKIEDYMFVRLELEGLIMTLGNLTYFQADANHLIEDSNRELNDEKHNLNDNINRSNDLIDKANKYSSEVTTLNNMINALEAKLEQVDKKEKDEINQFIKEARKKIIDEKDLKGTIDKGQRLL